MLGKVFASLDFVQFSECFSDWANSMSELAGGEAVVLKEEKQYAD